VLAHASGLCALCLCHEHGADDRWVPSDRPAAGRLLPVSVMPSRARIAAATGISFVIALVLLSAIVLPAEYGIDPLGTGRPLGLLDLFSAQNAATTPEPEAAREPPPRVYKTESTSFTLRPSQAFEYKYRLEKDRGMVYAWKATAKVK